MLVLSRKEGERIRIGEDIVISIVRTGNDRVRVGVEAPQNMVVLREELSEKMLPHKVVTEQTDTNVNDDDAPIHQVETSAFIPNVTVQMKMARCS